MINRTRSSWVALAGILLVPLGYGTAAETNSTPVAGSEYQGRQQSVRGLSHPGYIAEPDVRSLRFRDQFLPDLDKRTAISAAVADLKRADPDKFTTRVLMALAEQRDTAGLREEWLKLARLEDQGRPVGVDQWGFVDFCDSVDRATWAQLLTWLWLSWPRDQFDETAQMMRRRIERALGKDRGLIASWWDNDVHGRTAHMLETLVVAKILANQPRDAWARQRLTQLGDRRSNAELYSPYKIASTLNAFAGKSGGIQQTGKHLDAGWGDGYEGMYVRNPWLLLNLWQHCTGVDLLSRCVAFTKSGEAAYFRHKDYWRSPVHGRAIPILEQCGGAYGKLVMASYQGNVPAPELLFLYKDYQTPAAQPVQRAFRVMDGDGYIHYREGDLQIDVSAPWANLGGQRSEFKPRCFAYTKANKGLLWLHHFKGGMSGRSCSGIQFGSDYPMPARALHSSYYPTGNRPTRAEQLFTDPYHAYPQAKWLGQTSWLEEWGWRINRVRNKYALGVQAVGCRTKWEISDDHTLRVTDQFQFNKPFPVALTFTCSGVPRIKSTANQTTLVIDEAVRVTVSGTQFEVELIKQTGYTGNRDKWPRDVVYDPYDLGCVQAQVLLRPAKVSARYEFKTQVETVLP